MGDLTSGRAYPGPRDPELRPSEARAAKVQAHKFLLESAGWLGVVYREQVRRVKLLKKEVARK